MAEFGPPKELCDKPGSLLSALIDETGPSSADRLRRCVRGQWLRSCGAVHIKCKRRCLPFFLLHRIARGEISIFDNTNLSRHNSEGEEELGTIAEQVRFIPSVACF